jgi:hypothetical protein
VSVAPVHVAAGGASQLPHEPPQPSLPQTAPLQAGMQQALFLQPLAHVVWLEV